MEELPSRVGSPLSIKNLRETLQVAHDTVERCDAVYGEPPFDVISELKTPETTADSEQHYSLSQIKLPAEAYAGMTSTR